MRKSLITLGAAASVVLGSGAVAYAAPAGVPAPTQTQTAQAGAGLLKACANQGWKGLYTPIPVGTAPAQNNPNTEVDESKATVYTLVSREQCRAVVNASLPVGLLNGLPNSVIALPAPENFPTPPRTTPAPTPAVATLEGVNNGSATAPFQLTVKGVNLTPNADVSALVTYRDGRSVIIAAGKTNGEGVVTYPMAGACVKSQVPTSVTLLQYPSGPAATVAVPAEVCKGV